LDDTYVKLLAWINDKSSASKKAAYIQTRNVAQQRLWQMKEDWWTMKAKELQEAADRRDMKSVYDSLKAVYGTGMLAPFPYVHMMVLQ